MIGVDVLDPRVTLRRVWVLLHRLPPSVRRPGEAWSTEAELLATVIDHLAYLTWVTLKAAGAQSAQRPRPMQRPARRPGLAEPPAAPAPAIAEGERKTGSWAEAGELIAAMPGVVVSRE
jgi:hypothetical protein